MLCGIITWNWDPNGIVLWLKQNILYSFVWTRNLEIERWSKTKRLFKNQKCMACLPCLFHAQWKEEWRLSLWEKQQGCYGVCVRLLSWLDSQRAEARSSAMLKNNGADAECIQTTPRPHPLRTGILLQKRRSFLKIIIIINWTGWTNIAAALERKTDPCWSVETHTNALIIKFQFLH